MSSFISSLRRSVRSLSIESLEARRCFAADIRLDQGVLSIWGSEDADAIAIHDQGRGVMSVQDGRGARRQEFTGVTRIEVDTRGGNDSIRFSRASRAETLPPDLDLSSGDGDDDVQIALLLPAVQKVREAAARARVDLGDGHDRLRVSVTHADQLDLDLAAGPGDDDVGVALLLPAVQKVREAAARLRVELEAGDDQFRLNATGVPQLDLDLTAAEGDDDVAIGLLLPAVQKVREAAARLHLDLGAGADKLRANATGVERVELDLSAGDGDDDVGIGLLLPAVQKVREAAARMRLDLGAGGDQLRTSVHGFNQAHFDLFAGEGDDDVGVALLLPAVQKVREAAARAKVFVDLGAGRDTADVRISGFDEAEWTFVASDDDPTVDVRGGRRGPTGPVDYRLRARS